MSDLNDFDDSAGPTEGELVLPPSWQGLRQQIIYLAQFGNSIQVIHAEAGGGKTAFFEHLLAVGLGSTTVGVTVEQDDDLAAFYSKVLAELGLRPNPNASSGELAVALRKYVQTLHKERSRVVLLLDDAHHLKDSELGALVSVLQGQADAGVGLHVVLFAEPGLALRIDALQVLDVAVHDASLPVFSVAEMHQLLAQQGNLGHVTLEQVQRIWQQSKGLPGAALELLEDFQPPPTAVAKIASMRGLPMGHIAALLILCGVLVWAFLVRTTEDSPQNEALSDDFGSKKPLVIPIEAAARPSLARVQKSEQAATKPADTGSSTSDHARSRPVEPVTPATDSNVGANLDSRNHSEVVTVDDKGNAEAPRAASSREVASAQQSVANAAPTPQAAPSAPVSQTFAEQGAARLRSLPPNGYVLQLMAASAEDKLSAYVADQPNKANLYAYRTKRDGKALYILVEGFYADKDSAQAAVANLPPQQQEGGPWPKRIEQIHQELRNTP